MKLAIAVQRFGREVQGGAEAHAALVASLLARHHDVEVLTTTAGDYQTWSDAHPPGASEVDGLCVRRFPIVARRAESWPVMHRLLHEGFDASAFARLPAGVKDAFAARVRNWPDALQEEFIRAQGPIAPALQEHLRATDYDRVLFFTYLYPTTYDGLAAVPAGRARVIPTLHDEAPAYLPVFGRRLARAELLCSTQSEVDLVARLYPDERVRARAIGYGIDLPPDVGTSAADTSPDARADTATRAGSALSADPPPAPSEVRPFLLYAGRVDPQKGAALLLRWYGVLRAVLSDEAPALKLIGDVAMPITAQPGVELLGRVGEEEKLRLMRTALALVHPSPYESLGIVLLEALACRTPVIVNARCDVMVEHCRRSGAGVWIRDAHELIAATERLRCNPAFRAELGARGRSYVEREFSRAAYQRTLLDEFPVTARVA